MSGLASRANVLLVTHDAAFAALARHLSPGARFEVAGIGRRIPVALREVATRVHAVALGETAED